MRLDYAKDICPACKEGCGVEKGEEERPTPFEAGKTSEQLGIDTSRKFVVVNPVDQEGGFKEKGEILSCMRDSYETISGCMEFESVKSRKTGFMYWSELAYADDEPKPEAYEPRVGDRVSCEGEVLGVHIESPENGTITRLKIKGCLDGTYVLAENLSLLSRKTRTLTKAEAEALLTEKLGESVEIE